MPDRMITQRQMMNLNTQMKMWEDNLHPMFFLNFSRIREFYKNNGLRIQAINERWNKLLKDHCVIENGEVIYEADENGKKSKQPKLLEGVTPEMLSEAIKAFDEESTIIVF